ncbi:type I DNA topoisomerase [Barnesiella viscericola]|uniref:type I DNA topoisomerase n=1 Tax=Barnesiella viscericola TaxID=397865 RepID=UPI0025A369B6|nr:type I DNA topoisomerase [Barnesiella viscericola]MDM8268385.1 type I DNA topoisomerase [Barnesiella viscericola]
MAKNLVIVESPAKAKTIEKFLGKDYEVLSSYGHIRDLKKKDFSIDINDHYKPIYEIPADKKQVVDTLKAEAAKADMVWLASDEDREGEAIAWHLFEVLKLKPEKTKRIVFHEITKDAILHAIANPRDIDMHRVDAQQARRVLDRIVGFELSPVLWKKVKPALSAGRVQSVAVRLIVEREREIAAFKPEAAYRVVGEFVLPGGEVLKAELNQRLKTEAEAMALLEACKTAAFSIGDVTVKPARKSPAAPFTTSTLQQEAARKLGFSVAQTMMVAQRLYEAGHITYMRTDSVNLSSLALNTTKDEIIKTLGEKYLHTRNYHTHTKGAQEAHEAIRPTYISHREINSSSQEKRLYELIWKRTIASQMSDAELEKTTATITISGRKEYFVAVGEVLKFDGFLKVYMESTDDEGDTESNDKMLPPLTRGEALTLSTATATERFSQAPARYTEASLVRKLEELGIGRPSTYAPTISTIQQREYVEKGDRKGTERKYHLLTLSKGNIRAVEKSEITGADKGKLLPTDIGVVVTDFLTEYFPEILNYNFTANVEQQFDDIAEGKTVWSDEIDHFYKLFHPVVESAMALRLEHKVGERVLGTDPKSGRPVSVKIGRFGPLVQIGTPDDEEKPLFASLLKGQSMSTITLDEALKLFELPRTLGDYEGKTVVVGIGRFGPYIRHDGKYVSLPKEYTPQGVTLDEAIALIEHKREEEKQRFIKKFDEDPELELLNGRFGPYIAYKKKNYKLPKGTEPASLSFADCMKIIEEADKAPAKKKPVRKKSTK